MGLLSYADGAGKVQVAGPGAPMPVGSGDPSFLTASIPNGTAITPAIDLGSQRLHRIVIPAAWTAAAISFDVSYDGTNFAPLFNSAGEFSLASSLSSDTSAAPGRAFSPVTKSGRLAAGRIGSGSAYLRPKRP